MGRWRVIEFNDIGELVSPVAIAGFEGWNDAGEAASGVVNHLAIAWQASPVSPPASGSQAILSYVDTRTSPRLSSESKPPAARGP